MADAKLSSFDPVTSINSVDLIPVLQTGENKIATAGQLRAFIQTPISVNVTAGNIPLVALVNVSGACVLPAATIDGTRIILFGVSTGTVSSVGLLPADGFRFFSGNFVELFWAANTWNVLINNGMIVGLV